MSAIASYPNLGITPFLSDTTSALTLPTHLSVYPECYPESRWVSILIIINYATPMYATYCGMQTVLATNTLNTVNQNNLKATKSCECSANVWDTGGNLRVWRKEMNLRAKIRSDFPKVWANLALFPKEVFPDVGASEYRCAGMEGESTAPKSEYPVLFQLIPFSIFNISASKYGRISNGRLRMGVRIGDVEIIVVGK
ncbi:hypothetical protein B0H16DRAFT_1461382 [Mycena metata]|uniref:Uncharacterized protein n=1 Tax=Mycena metata TaxID=1033252 RepID=A0AAD7ITM6_9AGAR|nr:hypothetical protein B0H16DRAFT_1461382 [Mycena metata]